MRAKARSCAAGQPMPSGAAPARPCSPARVPTSPWRCSSKPTTPSSRSWAPRLFCSSTTSAFCCRPNGATSCSHSCWPSGIASGLSTVVTSRQPASACEANEAREALASFEDVHMEPLDHAGKCAFVRLAAAEYGTDASPLLERGSRRLYRGDDGRPLRRPGERHAYLMTDEGCAAHETLDAAAVQGLLQP